MVTTHFFKYGRCGFKVPKLVQLQIFDALPGLFFFRHWPFAHLCTKLHYKLLPKDCLHDGLVHHQPKHICQGHLGVGHQLVEQVFKSAVSDIGGHPITYTLVIVINPRLAHQTGARKKLKFGHVVGEKFYRFIRIWDASLDSAKYDSSTIFA